MKFQHLDLLSKRITEYTVEVMRLPDPASDDLRLRQALGQLAHTTLIAGASYRWGRRASNKREFLARLQVAQSEFEEVLVWLEMMRSLEREPGSVQADWDRMIAQVRKIHQVIEASVRKALDDRKDEDDGKRT